MNHCPPLLPIALTLALVGPTLVRAAAPDLFLDDRWRQDAGVPATDAIPAVIGPPPIPDARQASRIGPNDRVRVQVFQVDELTSEERVDADGHIVLPLIGPVQIGGLTPHEAEGRIAALLGKDYLQDPQVDVVIKEAANQKVTVLGYVKQPGVFPISGQTTLLEAIALAQGFDPLAREGAVILFRAGGTGHPIAYLIDAGAVQRGTLRDPVLLGEDRLVVPRSGGAALVKGVADTLRGLLRLPLF